MALRSEKISRRVAGRLKEATRSAASATRRASKALGRAEKASRKIDSRTVRDAKSTAGKVAKSAMVGAVVMGLRRAAAAAGKKLTEASRPKRNRKKQAIKVVGAVAAVAGAAVLARKAVKARQARRSAPKATEPEGEMERNEL
jgi:hypothetical protein